MQWQHELSGGRARRVQPWPASTDLCDVFMKIGGSILDDDAKTAALLPAITDLASQYRILILTGGGQVVRRFKANYTRFGSDFHSCWRAAVLYLDVHAGILCSYSPGLAVASSASEFVACYERGKAVAFAPATAILNNPCIAPDWMPTTDSMGLYFAKSLGARRYVIVSDVNGIYERRPERGTTTAPIPFLNIETLERLPSSKLDPVFPDYFRRYAVPTIVVNGEHPARVAAAIRGQHTVGTVIDICPSNHPAAFEQRGRYGKHQSP